MNDDRRGAAAAQASAAARAALADLRHSSPFSHGNVLSRRQKRRILRAANKLGLRPLPYPFASAVSIVSDLDGTNRERYDGYVGQLVGDLGLDFGDSTWLHWVSELETDGPEEAAPGEPRPALPHRALHAGFLSYDFGYGLREPAPVYRRARAFAEHLAQFHLGNLDHFHALLPKGPRVVVLDDPRVDGGTVELVPRGFEPKGRYCCYDTLLVQAVCVVAGPGRSLPELSVEVVDRDGATTDGYRPVAYPEPPNGRQHRLLAILPPLDAPPLPRLNRVARVVLRCAGDGDPASVDRVLLITAMGDLLLERLGRLRQTYNVELGLVTDHGALHFRNDKAAAIRDRQMREQHETGEHHRALPGSLTDDAGEVVFCTEADDPTSTCRVLPEMSRQHGLRFVVPAGNTASSAGGWQPLDLVTPARTRAGSGVYVARRMLPNIRAPLPGKTFDGTKSQHSTFVERLERVLDGTAESPGLAWPIYTHLGALAEGSGGRAPSPYFAGAAPRELQDRVLDVSGTVPAERRIWFCRPSVLYDYALMLPQIAERAERDGDVVRIRSWHDPILDRTLPVAPSQLYGLTFYVEDASRARLLLDDEPIETLVRNPADETGRASITVAESEIRHVLFERLDPARNLPHEIELAGGWRWREDDRGRAYGRLTAPAGDGADRLARLRLPLFGLAPWGAQLIAFDARRAPGARLGLLLETRGGGRFFFGDRRLRDRLTRPPTACYLFAPDESPDWRRHVAPFHDLAWAPGSRAGGPTPNQALEAITLLASPGAAGGAVDVGGVALLRPRATTRAADASSFCLAGRVPGWQPGQPVLAAALDSPAGERHECAVDPRGHFCFARLAPGIYNVWTALDGRDLCDRRGRLVELSANLTTLVLDRPAT